MNHSFKRRQFLGLVGQSAVGLAIPNIAQAICAPQNLNVKGGTTISSSPYCGPALNAEQDWQNRIKGSGVVWYHDFRSKAEVDAFRWTGGVGNDPEDKGVPNTCRWITTDKITGNGCLEIYRAAGTSEPSGWWRPLSAFTAPGNGKTSNDPGGGAPVRPWSPTQGGGQTQYFGAKAIYGNAIYDNGGFDGNEFYLQVRVKMDPNRLAAGNPSGGKLFYFTRTDRSLTSQEIVTVSGYPDSNRQNRFQLYRSGSPPLSNDPPFISQPNSEFNGTWVWPMGRWVTILYHIKHGTNANGVRPEDPGDPTGNPDTLVQVWVDWDGTKKVNKYIKIWDQPTVRLPYDIFGGHNALIVSGYMNGQNFAVGFYQRVTQIIFSKQFIPCPQV